MNPDDPNLLGPYGDPIRKPQTDREALEALIRSELADAKEQLRNSNKQALEEIADKYYKPKISFWHRSNAYTFAALVAVLVFGWFTIPDIIRTKTISYFRENLVGTTLTNTVNNIVSENASVLIETRLKPLKANVATIEAEINSLTSDISNKQAQLASDQIAIRKQLHPLSDQVISLKSSIDLAEAQASTLQEEQRLTTLMNRAEVFDSEAIRQLQAIAQGTNETAPLAQAMFNKIQRTLVIDNAALSYVIFNEAGAAGQTYGGPFAGDELAWNLANSPSPELDGVVNLIGKQPLFVPEPVKLAHQSKDLWTINRISKALNNIAGVSFFPWDLQPLDKWWAQNSMNYTNWPYDQDRNALKALDLGSYDVALTNFESVLAIDPTADKSRALAVACAIEIGNISKAQQLNTNYTIADGRWNQWAKGKMMLATNAIQQGTEEIASLVKKYPTFPTQAGIREQSYLFRQLDWPLFQKLIQTTNNTVSIPKGFAP